MAQSSRWADVRALDERRRCVRLARGLTLVEAEPTTVLSWFTRETVANALDPIGLAERALVARALLRSGDPVTAYAWFSALQAQSPIAAWHVFAVHDYAVSASRVGQVDVAANCYRRLTSLGAWLPSAMKASVFIEAAAVALRSTPPKALDALSYVASLEQETLAPDARRVTLVLQKVAAATLTPTAPITPLANVPGSAGAGSELRLADEDTRFIADFARYSETGQWPEEEDSRQAAQSSSFPSPAYAALIARLRALR
jgi:hypothetical protein